MTRRWIALCAVATALLLTSCTPPPPGAPLPVRDTNEGIVRGLFLEGDQPPPGANDWSCRPKPGEVPVVLVHGTVENMSMNWGALSPFLVNEGLCVFALNYGGLVEGWVRALGPIVDSSMNEIGPFIDHVLEVTGATSVDIVGHSQGGISPRYWMRYGDSVGPDGTPKVRNLVGLAPATTGTDFWGLVPLLQSLRPGEELAPGCGACNDMIEPSAYLDAINDTTPHPGERFSGPLQPGVAYTVIITQYDNVVTPPARSLLPAPATNIVLQDGCSMDQSDHVSMVYSPRLLDLVRNVLVPSRAAEPRCVWRLPFLPIDPYQTLDP